MPTVVQTGSGERIVKTTYLPPRVYRAIEHERTGETKVPFTALVTQLLEEALIARGINLEDFELRGSYLPPEMHA